jgi:hypothetical protein
VVLQERRLFLLTYLSHSTIVEGHPSSGEEERDNLARLQAAFKNLLDLNGITSMDVPAIGIKAIAFTPPPTQLSVPV